MAIFISYAKENKEQADRIAEKLEDKKIEYCLASKTVKGGELFRDEIRNHLIECEELFLLREKGTDLFSEEMPNDQMQPTSFVGG